MDGQSPPAKEAICFIKISEVREMSYFWYPILLVSSFCPRVTLSQFCEDRHDTSNRYSSPEAILLVQDGE